MERGSYPFITCLYVLQNYWIFILIQQMPGFNFTFHCQGIGKVVILVLISSPFILRRFYACSLFDHGSRRVRPWLPDIYHVYITYIPRIYHAYITYLCRCVIYAWMLGRICIVLAPNIWSNHGRTLLEPWSNLE